MELKRNLFVFFVVGLILLVAPSVQAVGKAETYSYLSCSQELKNSNNDIHLVVENCTNVGTFSLGGLYQNNWEKLTFFYPFPWEGTFLTLKVDDEFYTNSFIPEANYLDYYLLEGPVREGNEIRVKWFLPEGIWLEEIFSVTENGTFIKFKLRNQGTENREVGLRLHLDTMIGDNDGAPIYLPGKGLITQEKSYENINFDYWKAYNRKEAPTIISTGILSGDGLTPPDKLIIASWRKSTHSSWDYFPEGISILGDSAVLLYFAERILSPDEEREILTYYGRGTSILPEKEDFGIGEITSGKIKGYCPGELVTISVDLVNKGPLQEGNGVKVIVKNSSGFQIFSQTKKVGLIEPDSVKPITFSFSAPSGGYPLAAEAVLIDKGGRVVAKKVKAGCVNLRSACPLPPKKAGLNLFFLTIFSILLLAGILVVLYSSKSLGEVVFKKTKIKNQVKVVVWNQSKQELKDVVIEDKLPKEETEVDIPTFGVIRSHHRLSWKVGNLKPGAQATLEYTFSLPLPPEGEITSPAFELPPAKLIWESGEKESQNIIQNPEKTKAF